MGRRRPTVEPRQTAAHAVYAGPVVYHDEDEHGAIDVVEEGNGKLRSLQFGTSARQSTMFVADPDVLALEYTRYLMMAMLFLPADPSRVLMLGLGGGSLPKFVRRQVPACRVEVVELRTRVVAVARRYFDVPGDDEWFRVHVADGRRFLLRDGGATDYDLVVVDLHSSGGLSPVVLEADFMPACRHRLAGGGVLAANLWYGVNESEERLVRQRLTETFERVLFLPVAGKRNCVALGVPRAELPDLAELRARARLWQARAGLALPELLPDLIRHNLWRPSPLP